jgi:hypothetical protein
LREVLRATVLDLRLEPTAFMDTKLSRKAIERVKHVSRVGL